MTVMTRQNILTASWGQYKHALGEGLVLHISMELHTVPYFFNCCFTCNPCLAFLAFRNATII